MKIEKIDLINQSTRYVTKDLTGYQRIYILFDMDNKNANKTFLDLRRTCKKIFKWFC